MSAPVSAAGRGARIEIDGVTHDFGSGGDRRRAVEGIDLDIAAGEFLCLLGPSGCGKSTLLNLVAGFLAPSSGSVVVGGRPVQGPGADRGVVFQQPRLLPWKTVQGNVELGPRFAGASQEARADRAREVLELVGLGDVAGRRPYELSGGMQQRVAIARALAVTPQVLLMDEPFAALDAITRERLQDEVLRIWHDTGMTVVFVTHSVDEAVYVGSRVVALSAHPGRIVADLRLPVADLDDLSALRDSPELLHPREELREVIRSANAS